MNPPSLKFDGPESYGIATGVRGMSPILSETPPLVLGNVFQRRLRAGKNLFYPRLANCTSKRVKTKLGKERGVQARWLCPLDESPEKYTHS